MLLNKCLVLYRGKQELKVKPCPVVFASFSGGPKACMYKVLQMTEGIISLPYKQNKYNADLLLPRCCY
ncbi:hypothetical protein ACOSQ4_030797 [Xanthoceras sorbifolium]